MSLYKGDPTPKKMKRERESFDKNTISLEIIATHLWAQEARRANMTSTAKRRTREAFAQESEETRVRWLGLAEAAVEGMLEAYDEIHPSPGPKP